MTGKKLSPASRSFSTTQWWMSLSYLSRILCILEEVTAHCDSSSLYPTCKQVGLSSTKVIALWRCPPLHQKQINLFLVSEHSTDSSCVDLWPGNSLLFSIKFKARRSSLRVFLNCNCHRKKIRSCKVIFLYLFALT